MCIILGVSNSDHPSDTHIFNLPVIVQSQPNVQNNLLIYSNSFKLNKYNPNEIMIVVVPMDPNTDIGLIDISKQNIRLLRHNLTTAGDSLIKYDELKKLSKSLNNASNVLCSKDLTKAIVHEIGSYNISVVNSTKELIDCIDWSKFGQIPIDISKRIETIDDVNLFPFEHKALIVAISRTSIDSDGFGIVYSAPKIKSFFPTCHEHSKEKSCKYDVKLYELSDDISNITTKPTFITNNKIQYSFDGNIVFSRTNYQTKSFVGKINTFFGQQLNDLIKQTKITWSNNGQTDYIIGLKNVTYLETIPIKTTGPNQNFLVHSKSDV